MLKFIKESQKELKSFFYNSHIHDATIECFKYDIGTDSIEIKLVNSIYDHEYILIFEEIQAVAFIRGTEYGSSKNILSLTIENSCVFPSINENIKFDENCLYLFFQMFSGDELHIVSNKLVIYTNQKQSGDGSMIDS